MISAAWKAVELDEKMVEAEEKHAELRVQCEKAKTECVKIDNLTKMCNSINETISALDVLTKKIVVEVKNIISTQGSDYSTYTNEQKNKVFLMMNFSLALNDLVCTDAFDSNGVKYTPFTKVYNEAKNLLK